MFHLGIRIRYQTVEFGELDIHLRCLRDTQECQDEGTVTNERDISSGNWSLFGVVWTSGESLARLMCDYEIEGRRILEVGCGLGLASLVLNHRVADISATDNNPEAEAFLEENVKLNGGRPIPFARAHWDELNCGLGKFDLIIGSDLLYERGAAELLSAFIDEHAQQKCEVVIVDPGRGQIGRFGRLMAGRGYSGRQLATETEDESRRREQTHSYRRE